VLPEDYTFWSTWGDYQRWPLDRSPPPPVNTPEEPQGMDVWRERFHEAVYTTLLMGAVFARAYNQPFYPPTTRASPSGEEADEGAEACRRELLDLLCKASARSALSYFGIGEAERDYLGRFPVFDLNDTRGGQKETFGPFIEWFIRSVILQHQADPPKSSRDLLLCDEARAARDGQEDLPCLCSEDWPDTGGFSQWFSGGSPAEGEAVLWRLMQLIHMFEFILTCIENADGKPRLGREWWRWKRSARSVPGTTRTIRVVLFGVFQAEEVVMPDDIVEAVYQQLLAHGPHASDSAASISPPNLDIPLVLENLYLRSGIPNKGVAGEYNRRYNLPPPPLQIFTFTLRHHFNLQIHRGAFNTHVKEYQDYHYFKSRATIFANGLDQVPDRNWADCTNGTEFLVEYQPPTLRYSPPVFGDETENPRTWFPMCFPESRYS
jgi:hypothetical protein